MGKETAVMREVTLVFWDDELKNHTPLEMSLNDWLEWVRDNHVEIVDWYDRVIETDIYL